MEAAGYILMQLTSADVTEAIRILALYLLVAYPVAQGLLIVSANVERHEQGRKIEEMKARAEANAELMMTQKMPSLAGRPKATEPGAAQSTYLTNEQRELGKKLIEEARKAGH